MDTGSIRRKVADAIGHEENTGALYAHARQAFEKLSPDESPEQLDARTAMLINFVRDYVSSLPEIIEQTLKVTDAAGVAEEVRPVFEAAISYLDEEVDFIPDTLGLAGLLDDAYLIRELMQELNHRHRVVTGEVVFPTDHKRENQMVRRLMGEPTATRLDAAVIAFARRERVRETIQQIMTRVGGQRLAMSLPLSMAFGGGTGAGTAAEAVGPSDAEAGGAASSGPMASGPLGSGTLGRDGLPDLQLGQL